MRKRQDDVFTGGLSASRLFSKFRKLMPTEPESVFIEIWWDLTAPDDVSASAVKLITSRNAAAYAKLKESIRPGGRIKRFLLQKHTRFSIDVPAGVGPRGELAMLPDEMEDKASAAVIGVSEQAVKKARQRLVKQHRANRNFLATLNPF